MQMRAEERTTPILLYVDDDEAIRQYISVVLRSKFPQLIIIMAENGRKGLELFIEHEPDIVLTDILMQDIDGISMSREIKAINKGAHIIALTAASNVSYLIDAIEIGISHYVLKPLKIAKLVAAIDNCLESIRLEKKLSAQNQYIKHMAYHDLLTGLPNRELLNELIHFTIAKAQRHKENNRLAVLFLDLDRFKVINDTLGHAIGDQLLQAVANRLKECCRRDRDIVARWGGDEFIVLLPELDTPQEAVRVARKIIDAFGESFSFPDHELFVSTCVGISIYPEDGDNADTLIRNADMAMYRAKEHGSNRYHLYNSSMNNQAALRLAMEFNLRYALEKQEFSLEYQPKVNVKTGRVVSFEALVRWNNPELGQVEPKQFIAIAEETGFIVPFGEWILRSACSQNRAWQDAGHPPLRVAVNFSPRQFHSLHLAEMVENVLAETNLEPCWLEIEITESVMLKHLESTVKTLHRLSSLGVHISIDDFGTGYSSLSYIKKLPINTLKIDQSFVDDITTNGDDAAIATAVINLAQSLRLNVVAEGVEYEAQAVMLNSLQCSEMQGFFFSRPLSAEAFPALLHRLHWRCAHPSNNIVH